MTLVPKKSGSVPTQLETPHAAALAGVAFAILFSAALILFHTRMPDGPNDVIDWLNDEHTGIKTATVLMPFAGIAFLWFLAVVRDGFGRFEDRFFSTVFLAAGILFLAMTFVATSIAAGLIASNDVVMDPRAHVEVVQFGKSVFVAISQTYALRMGAVFMISLATIWLKTSLMPKWLALVTYLGAIVLLVIADNNPAAALAFPIWVGVVSVLLLARARHIQPSSAAEAGSAGV